MRYSVLHMCRLMLLLVGWSHLQACVWGLATTFEGKHQQTWLDELALDLGVENADAIDPWAKYTAGVASVIAVMPVCTHQLACPLNPSNLRPSGRAQRRAIRARLLQQCTGRL